MTRDYRWSSVVLAVFLTPALLQSDCGPPPTGDTTLAALSLDVSEQDQVLGFRSSVRGYSVWLSSFELGAVLTAVPNDPTANVTWSYGEASGGFGVGGGQQTIDIPPGTSRVFVFVRPTGGAVGSYQIDINPMCSESGVCNDGNSCTDDAACDIATNLCPAPAPTRLGAGCDAVIADDGLCDGMGACEPIGSNEWGIPRQLESSIRDARHPSIAADGLGNAFVVWEQESSSGSSDVLAIRYTPTEGWGVPVALEPRISQVAYPQVVADAAGNAIAMWEEDDLTRKNIWVSRYTPASGWGEAELLETDDVGDAVLATDPLRFTPRQNIAMAPDGTAIAVWSQSEGPPGIDVFGAVAAHFSPGVGWSAPVVLDTSDEDGAGGVRIALAANGHAVAVWEQHDPYESSSWGSGPGDSGARGHFARTYTPTGGWGSVTELGFGGGVFSNPLRSTPAVAIDESGNALALGEQSDCCGNVGGLHFNLFSPSSGWGGAVPFGEGGLESPVARATGDFATLSRNEDRSFTPSGFAYASSLWGHRITDGIPASPDAILEAPGGGLVDGLLVGRSSLAAGPGGDLLAVWGAPFDNATADEPANVLGARFSSGSWGPVAPIEYNGVPGPPSLPRVVFLADGGAMATWIDVGEDFSGDLWAVRLHP